MLRGPHDLRHTFSTWLEEAGIPARVIDELMGHAGGRRGAADGSATGDRYRHTTPEMERRVVAAIEQRLAVALAMVDRHAAVREAAMNDRRRRRQAPRATPVLCRAAQAGTDPISNA
jgi:hypothetical protein